MSPDPTSSGGPLAGIRVVDVTTGVAGPAAAQNLTYLGAEVIRVHSELQRRGPVADDDPAANILQTGKLSIRLNLRDPRGLELAKRLVAVSDVLIENMRPGTLQKMGLDYDTLREVKPDIVAVSLSTSGYGGKERDVGYAPNFVARSGLASMSGYEGGPPAEYVNWPDLVSGNWLVFGLIYGLLHRERTGEGQYIDLSAVESLTTLLGDQLMTPAMTGRNATQRGNFDERMAPHNAYRTADGRSVAIAVASDEEWRALCVAIGREPLAADPRFANLEARREHVDEVDAAVSAWVVGRSREDAVATLQAVGVAVTPVMNNADLLHDPHIRAQGRWSEIEHPKHGHRTVMGPPWKFSATPAEVRGPAPLSGQHEGYVFGDLLGLPEDEIESLRADRVIR